VVEVLERNLLRKRFEKICEEISEKYEAISKLEEVIKSEVANSREKRDYMDLRQHYMTCEEMKGFKEHICNRVLEMDTKMKKIASNFKTHQSVLEKAAKEKKEMLLNAAENLDSRTASTKTNQSTLSTDLISMLQTFKRDRLALESYAKRIEEIQRDMEKKSDDMIHEARMIRLDMKDKKNAELCGLNALLRGGSEICFGSEDLLSRLWAEEQDAIMDDESEGYYFLDYKDYEDEKKFPELYSKLNERALVLRKVALHFEGETRRLLKEWLDVLRERDVVGSGDWQSVVQWETLGKKYCIEGKTLKVEKVPEIPDWMSDKERSYLQRFATFVVRVTAWIELKKEHAELPRPVSIEWDTLGKKVTYDQGKMNQIYSDAQDGQLTQILFPAILKKAMDGSMIRFCNDGSAQPIVCKAAKDIPARFALLHCLRTIHDQEVENPFRRAYCTQNTGRVRYLMCCPSQFL